MKKIIIKQTIIFILLFALACIIYPLHFVCSVNAAEPSVMIRGARPLAMGGTFIALADDQNAFFYNPAGFALRDKGMFTLFEIPITMSKDIHALYSYYNDNKDALEKFDEQDDETQQKIMNDIVDRLTLYKVHFTAGVPNLNFVTGPIELDSGDKMYFGLGIFSLIDVRLKVNAGILVPTLDFWGSGDVVGIVPVVYKWTVAPFELPGSISLGTNLKYITRARLAETRRSILELENYDPAFQPGTGIGLDLGLLYEINEQWNAGMMVSDLGGTTIKFKESTSAGITTEAFSDVIRPKLNVGCAFKPDKLYYWPGKYLDIGTRRLRFAFDLNNITDTEEKLFAETFFMKVNMGAELKWKMLAFRGGINKGYPTFGMGLYLLFLNLDYAFYVDELGKFAGTNPEVNHMVNIAFRF